MLDEKDLHALAGLITKSEKRLIGEMDKRIATSESLLIDELDKRFAKSESLLLDELDRYNTRYEKRFDSIDKDLEELKSIYRMTKTENETINMLLRIIENLEKRIPELEKKTA